MESEGRPGPPLMLKEWLELENSAELSRDGFGCYPRRLGAELIRSGSARRRNGDVIARVSAAVRAALFPPSGGEGEGEVALSGNSSRRLRVRFWKKRSWEGEEVASGVSSCSATTVSGRRDGSSPSTSLRRRSWKIGQAGGVGAGAAGRRRHETGVPGFETTRHLDQEQEQKQRLSPVSVMDFLSQDEDDGNDEEGDGYGEDDEIASPTYQRSLANIRRASQQLLQKIRQFEQLAELEISDDVDDATTATEDASCHVAAADSVEDGEGAPVQSLLDLLEASSPGSTRRFQKLLEDFFCDGLKKSDGPDRAKPLLETAKTWSNGQDRSLRPFGRREVEWLGRWRCFREDELELLAVDLEGEIFSSLVGELVERGQWEGDFLELVETWK